MEYTQDIRTPRYAQERARTLVEALPWLKSAAGKTLVIKYGGAAMVDDELRREVMEDIVLLKYLGVRPLLVHGGGKAVSAAMEAAGIPVEFKDGMRVTTPEAMAIVREVLSGTVNSGLVTSMNVHGALAVGLSGMDANVIMAEPISAELGRVGRVTSVNADYLMRLLDADYIPVLSSIASDGRGGCLNVNADVVAGAVAEAVGAHKLVYITDVDGVYEDFSDKGSLIARMTADEAEALAGTGSLSKGMIPKIDSCVSAIRAGVSRCHIINGTRPHSLLLEMLTDEGIGTMVTSEQDAG
ncbi:MAG: acetylglutamate kinase [Atopobiaceae bacterium]|jgi:acetylglutamate kinase|nr:acetylglutamate kinase [Atopobiaceae bacterium]MCH4181514.1 acetylglutamate kinase [Atopobiaceae bacterium]MCH4214075.1 acetylglutamate kinase [Atopobiaceae bacterium]MCH4229538.1 acetylglutamate kinase [Atopobiaceae bacterium]MCH4276427.1 acetylglutamate kinase [Atopobiaceae bacterium]